MEMVADEAASRAMQQLMAHYEKATRRVAAAKGAADADGGGGAQCTVVLPIAGAEAEARARAGAGKGAAAGPAADASAGAGARREAETKQEALGTDGRGCVEHVAESVAAPAEEAPAAQQLEEQARNGKLVRQASGPASALATPTADRLREESDVRLTDASQEEEVLLGGGLSALDVDAGFDAARSLPDMPMFVGVYKQLLLCPLLSHSLNSSGATSSPRTSAADEAEASRKRAVASETARVEAADAKLRDAFAAVARLFARVARVGLAGGVKEEHKLNTHRALKSALMVAAQTPLQQRFTRQLVRSGPPAAQLVAEARRILANAAGAEWQAANGEQTVTAMPLSPLQQPSAAIAVAVPMPAAGAPPLVAQGSDSAESDDDTLAVEATAQDGSALPFRRSDGAPSKAECLQFARLIGAHFSVACAVPNAPHAEIGNVESSIASQLVSALRSVHSAGQLPPKLGRIWKLMQQLASLHLRRKLPGRASKIQSVLAILPVRALASMLAGRDAESTSRGVLGLLFARPVGGDSVMQRLAAVSSAIDSQKQRLEAARAGLPPLARQAVDHLIRSQDRAGWPVGASGFETLAQTRQLLQQSSPGAPSGVEAELDAPQVLARAQASVAAAHSLHAATLLVQLLGHAECEQAIATMMPLFATPLLKLLQRGDVPGLVARALPPVEALLQVVGDRGVQQCEQRAAFDFATSDLFDAGFRFAQTVARAHDGQGELLEALLEWALQSWFHAKVTFVVPSLSQDLARHASALALKRLGGGAAHGRSAKRLSSFEAGEALLREFEERLTWTEREKYTQG